MTAPEHATPACARCGGPRTELDHEGLAPGYLRCCACGEDAPATEAELAQARRADEAYLRTTNPELFAEPDVMPPARDDKTLPLFPEVTRG